MKKEQTLSPEVIEAPVEPFPDYAAIRTSKGIELKTLSNATKIRVSYLEAIEKGNFDTLPESIYAETFIRTYARALGEDADVILSHYRRHLKKNENASPEAAPKQVRPKPVVPAEKTARAKFPFKTIGWIFSALVVIVFLISFFSTYTTDHRKPEAIKPLAAPPAATVAPAQDPAAPGQVAPTTAGETPAAATTAVPSAQAPPPPVVKTPYKLVIEATATSWLNIVEDDNPPYELLLRPGERIEREATDKFSVDIGNAGGVVVYFQGKSLGTLGKSGQVVHLNLPHESRNQ